MPLQQQSLSQCVRKEYPPPPHHLFRDSTEHAMTIETREPSSINVVAVAVVDTLPVRTKIKALIIIIINHCLSYFVL